MTRPRINLPLLAMALSFATAGLGLDLPVRQVSFEGNQFRSARQLRKLMRLRWPGGRFDRDSLQRGLDRIDVDYSGQGFSDCHLEYLVRLDSSRSGDDVIVYLSEGGQYRIASVQFSGNVALSGDSLAKAVRTRSGMPYNPAALGQDDFNLMMLYADHGLIYAEAGHQAVIDDDHAVRITFEITEGDPVRIGAVAITGNRFVSQGAVDRELTVRKGELFSSRELAASRTQLMTTGLFKEAAVVPGPLSPDGKTIDLDVQLRERPRRRFETGFGYGSGDAFRVSSSWSNCDLDGWGRSIEFSGQIAFQLWSTIKLVRGLVQAGCRDPWFLGRRRAALLDLYYDDIRPAYTVYRLQTVGAYLKTSIFTGTYSNAGTTWKQEWLRLSPDWTKPDNDADTLRYQGRRSIALFAAYERTLDPVNPIRGFRSDAETEYSGGLLGGINTFQRMTAAGIIYGGWPALPLQFSARLQGGIIGDWSRRFAVPVYEKFTLGGPNTLRGFALGMAGPADSAGLPFGGDKMLLANIEWRTAVYRNWRIVLFADAGLVSNRSFRRVSLREAYGSPGAGLRYVFPIGSARLDAAAPWSQVRLLRKWRLVLAWGEAF